MGYVWEWDVFLQPAVDGSGNYAIYLLKGLYLTVTTAILALVVAVLLGTLVGIARTLPNPLISGLARAYVEIFRNIPLLVQLFLWYFVVPELLPSSWGDWLKSLPNAPFLTAFLGLGLYSSARIAEQTRAGIRAIPFAQTKASLALGMTLPQTYRYVLIPRVYIAMIPTLTTEVLALMKNSSVALTIGLAELTSQARSMQEYTFHVFEAFAAATVLYFALNIVVVQISRWIERRTDLSARF